MVHYDLQKPLLKANDMDTTGLLLGDVLCMGVSFPFHEL